MALAMAEPKGMTEIAPEDKPRATELIVKGKRLIDEAKESSSSEKPHLVAQGLKLFIRAAAEESRDAVKRINSLFSDLSNSVINELPSDLRKMAYILVKSTDREKEVYVVAKDIFETMAERRDYIYKDEIGEAVERLLATKREDSDSYKKKLRQTMKKLLNSCLSTNDKGDIIVTEDKFCLTACLYSRGEADLLSSVEAEGIAELTSEELDSFEKSNWLKKVTSFPSQSLRLVSHYVLQTIERYGMRWVWSMFPLRQFFILLLIYLVPLINIQFMLSGLATLAFFICLMGMVVSTLQVIANSSKVKSYEEYSVLFSHFAESEEDKDAILNNPDFIVSSAIPYATYSLTTVLGIFLMGMALEEALFYEILVIIAGAMSLLVFFQFSCWKSPLILLVLSTRLLSWGLVFLYMFSSLVPIPDLFFITGWNLVSIPVFPGIWIGINITSLIQIPLHIALVLYYGSQYSWKNLFYGLGPYLLFISWWIFCRSIFTHSSVVSLFIFGPGVLFCLFFLPFLPMLIVSAPLIILIYYGFSVQLLISLILLLIVSIASVLLMKYYQHLKDKKALKLNININHVLIAQFLIGGILFIAGTLYYNSPPPSSFDILSFEEYNHLCGVDTSINDNLIQNQLDCLHLKGSVLSVEIAQIKEVRISEITNSPLTTLSNFPDSVRNTLTCLMGETKPFCGRQADSKTCIFKGCHFDSKNQYNVHISTMIPSGGESLRMTAVLSVWMGHQYLLDSNLLKLKSNQFISFNATLEDGLGTQTLNLKLLSYQLKDGSDEVFDSSEKGSLDKESKGEILDDFWSSVISMAKFVTEILFGYSSSEYYKP